MELDALRQPRRLGAIMLPAAMLGFRLLGPEGAVAGLLLAFAAAIALVQKRPDQRHWIEIAGLGLFVAALLPLPFGIGVGVVLAAGLGWVLHRAPFTLRRTQRQTRAIPSQLAPDEIWRKLMPGAGLPEEFWTGRVIDYDADPEDPETLYLVLEAADGGGGETGTSGGEDEATATILEAQAPSLGRYHLETGLGADRREGIVEFVIDSFGPMSQVSIRFTEEAVPLGQALSEWVDGGTPFLPRQADLARPAAELGAEAVVPAE